MKVQKIVVNGFLHLDGIVLIIKRSQRETCLPGFFELPGGKVDFGETPQEALKREFHEETNLSIEVGKPFFTFSYLSEDGKRHTVEIVYFVSIRPNTSAKIHLSEDHTEYHWIAENEAEQYPLSSTMKKVIREGFSSAK
jgi:8-oxo-dGTP diphosphatase